MNDTLFTPYFRMTMYAVAAASAAGLLWYGIDYLEWLEAFTS
jgi:hypothetical protein